VGDSVAVGNQHLPCGGVEVSDDHDVAAEVKPVWQIEVRQEPHVESHHDDLAIAELRKQGPFGFGRADGLESLHIHPGALPGGFLETEFSRPRPPRNGSMPLKCQ
jgi:hypothetical protein